MHLEQTLSVISWAATLLRSRLTFTGIWPRGGTRRRLIGLMMTQQNATYTQPAAQTKNGRPTMLANHPFFVYKMAGTTRLELATFPTFTVGTY